MDKQTCECQCHCSPRVTYERPDTGDRLTPTAPPMPDLVCHVRPYSHREAQDAHLFHHAELVQQIKTGPVKDGEEKLLSGNHGDQQVSYPSRRRQCHRRRADRPRWRKRLCCLGWVVCLPLFLLCCCLREKPADDEDLKEDDCYPCY